MLNRLSKFIFFILIAFLPCVSMAVDAPLRVARWYKIYWNGLYIADLKVEIGENNMISQIDSLGVVKTISNYANRTYSKFHMEKGLYIQDYFESRLQQRKGTKEVRIYYAADGKIRTEVLTPPDSPGKRPKVSDDMKIGASNPLFAAIVARDKIKAAITGQEKTFNFNIYEGRRLSRLDFIINGKENIKILDKNIDVVKISFRRVPIAGFNKKELDRMKGEEPDFIVYLEEDTLLPIKADAAAPLGKAKFILEKECRNIEECR